MDKKELATCFFEKGYTCSQAVVLAFKDILNIDENQLKKLALPFGGGMGRMRLTCGAASAIVMIIGILFSDENINSENKKDVYQITQNLLIKFQEINGSLICQELLNQNNNIVEIGNNPEARNEEYYQKRPCSRIVYNATLILEEYLKEQKIL